ncbi:GH36-type glycosyl hydrolase domain-containing protein [Gorillibacterium sp. sgz5001074]|uniref:GH36-type glycosyl hydrolase domain-containing protein n=1 Tax=Gorillibacterium sp. sgz5001074 TaxID=3446695 RepID=UPI003F6800A2
MPTFGHFSQEGSEFVFTTPRTPRPMLNYLWNPYLLSGVNQTGGGTGAYGDRAAAYIDQEGKGRAVIIKNGNRYFYIRDEETGEFWNPGWYPANRELDHYSCVHGLGHSTISGAYGEITAEARVFINQEDPAEIWTLTLTNQSGRARELKVYSFVEFSLSGYKVYSNYYSNLFTEFDSSHNLIMAYNTTQDRTHAWFNGFIAASAPVSGFDSSRKAFVGTYGHLNAPAAVVAGRCSGSLASNEDMVGVLEHTITLQPGESYRYHILIGAADTADRARSIAAKLFEPGAIERDFAALQESRQELKETIRITTPDSKVNNLINAWIKQQVQLCAEAGRDTGKGFRDQLQDAWAITSFNPALAKDKILETLRYQYSDGRCVRGWLPLDPHIYSDGPTWIAPTVNAYLKETGDYGFLNIRVPYLDEGEATVWEHILTAVRYSSGDTGERGLVRAHDGDWNDSLNGIGIGGKGESVWTSIALYYALHQTAEMAAMVLKDEAVVNEMNERAEIIARAVNDKGWDGEWYLAGYNDAGDKVGTHTETEGSIYLNSQTWALMSGLAAGERIGQCLKAIDERLDSPYGPLTLSPTYTSYKPEIGRLTGFVPGIWENGAPYCHGGTFKIVSDCCLGRGNEAYQTMLKIMPDSPTNPSEYSGCEPYVLTNMYFGPDNPRAGQTMFAWVTGTAGWIFRSATQYMLGFHPGYDSFKLEPVLPEDWKECRIRRSYRGDIYEVQILNPDGVQAGVRSITLDGMPVEGTTLPIQGDGKTHHIVVLMG